MFAINKIMLSWTYSRQEHSDIQRQNQDAVKNRVSTFFVRIMTLQITTTLLLILLS